MSVAISSTTPAVIEHQRRPWVAGLFSVFVPGLGHIYAGKARLGIAMHLGFLGWCLALLWIGVQITTPAARMVTLLLLPVGLFVVIGHACGTAERTAYDFQPRWYNRWYVYTALWLIAAIVAQGVYAFTTTTITRAFVIPGAAMQPTLLPGDYIFVSPGIRAPLVRGEPIVFVSTQGTPTISRLVGLPGDTLEMRENVLFLNGVPQEEPYALFDQRSQSFVEDMLWQKDHLVPHSAPSADYRPSLSTWGPVAVPAGAYFVMGDNRDWSLDSRVLGFVPREALFGRPVWTYFSRDAFAGVRWERLGRSID